MKKILLILMLVFPMASFGQYQYGFLQEFFFGRQPSARAEALGKAYSSIDGDLATIFYNPSGTASIQGATINTSFASPLYMLENAQYSFISAGYNFHQYLTIGMSSNHFTAGQEVSVVDIEGNTISAGHIPTNTLYTLNISSQPVRDLFIGLNVNHLIRKLTDESAGTFYFDFGVIKKIAFAQKTASHHAINVGASITNLNRASLKTKLPGNEIENELPVISRYGLHYQYHLNKKWISDSLNTLRLLVLADYQLLLNSDYHSGMHTGLELRFLEMLSFRIGYFIESQYDYGLATENESEISDFTYGLGLQIPLNKLSRILLNIQFDYASLAQPSYTKTQTSWDNFSTFTLRLNWIVRK